MGRLINGLSVPTCGIFPGSPRIISGTPHVEPEGHWIMSGIAVSVNMGFVIGSTVDPGMGGERLTFDRQFSSGYPIGQMHVAELETGSASHFPLL